MAAEGTGFLFVIFLKFRAGYQTSTKSGNGLQVEDIVLGKRSVPKIIV